jgi:hypothetical protein
MVSPLRDQFGCGYCRRKGGPIQIQEFYDLVMIARRQVLGASATLLSTPAVVRSASLIRVRGITYPIERHYYGFLDRWYVPNFLRRIN